MLEISTEAKDLAEKHDFEIQGYKFEAKSEDLRQPRVVRIGAVQNRIVASTSSSIKEQRDAIHNRIVKIIEAAHHAGVNVLCMQELWSKFCSCKYHRK